MKMKKSIGKLLSGLLCLAMLISCLPATALFASAVPADSRVADRATIDDWEKFFLPEDGSLTTENAGGIWTDKSIVTASQFADYKDVLGGGIEDSENGFLVALSAIGSNMTITGKAATPTDTVLVLDTSGSMGAGYNNIAKELVASANTSIQALLDANPENRIGVVLYSDTVTTMLPLDRYTTANDDIFLNYSTDNSSVVLDENVRNSQGNRPYSGNRLPSKQVSGGTYIQRGIIAAMEQFTASTNAVTVNGMQRKPVMVLMSDGAPTFGSSNFKSLSNDMGTGGGSNAGLGFVTQLTAAYAKNQIEAKYKTDSLMYTLGIAIGSGTNSNTDKAVAASVLDPEHSSNAVNAFWTQWKDAAVNDKIHVQAEDWWYGLDDEYVVKTSDVLDQKYVDHFFSAEAAADEGITLEQALKNAFQEIIGDIALQSAYAPTQILGAAENSGFISFVDRIGRYMKVTDMKGIVVGDQTLFSGADLARNFVPDGGALGSIENPTELGDNLVWAVMERIGVPTAQEARTLIGLAYTNKQLYYDETTGEWSNYIGWYANAECEFLGFWHEGITTMPDPADPSLTDATRPAYIIKSYGYVGDVNYQKISDMLYATVQVREEIATGDQTVTFAVPAALLPVVTYNVDLDEKGDPENLATSGETTPIRLIYETELDPAINEFNFNDKVSQAYRDANTVNGEVTFYANLFDKNNVSGDGTTNAYAYFTPSAENNRYYYQEDALVYTDTNGTLYRGSTRPTGTMYHAYTVYTKKGGTLKTELIYHELTEDNLRTAQQTQGDTTWYIPEGNTRRDYQNYIQEKADPARTDTLGFVASPFTRQPDGNEAYLAGVVMGNNAKLTASAGTGIKLTKALVDAQDAGKAFSFTITNTTQGVTDANTYPAYKLLADGTVDDTVTGVKFTDGKATVTLKAGETLMLGDMTDGHTFAVEEAFETDFLLQSVNGIAGQRKAELTVSQGTFVSADFVNTLRGTGNLSVGKEITHPFGTGYTVSDQPFTMQVTLTLNDVPLAGRKFNNDTVTTDTDGKFTFDLKHNEQFVLYGVPAGTVAKVEELMTDEQEKIFTVAYWESLNVDDGTVVIVRDDTVSVGVRNDYQPKSVWPVDITVTGSKTLTGDRGWKAGDKFDFLLQKWNDAAKDWNTLPDGAASVEVKEGDAAIGSNTAIGFSFTDAFASEEYTAPGVYLYRIKEVVPDSPMPGVSYDEGLHGIRVTVTDVMDGQLKIESVTVVGDTTLVTGNAAEGFDVTTAFTNVYEVGSTTASAEITKKVNNPSESPLATLDGFRFAAYEYTKEGDKIVLGNQVGATTAPTDGAGIMRIPFTFEREGTYRYAIKEIEDSVPGWSYSQDVQLITVQVTTQTVDGEDYLVAIAYAGEGDTAPDGATGRVALQFTNTYDPEDATLKLDFIKKTLTGRAMAEGEFSFKLVGQNYDVERTGTNAAGADGETVKVSFNDDLYFSKVGTYQHNIVETTTDGNGIITDKHIYMVTVTVQDIAGELVATYVVLETENDEVVFTNTYKAAPKGKVFTGNKTLTGRPLLNDEFTFLLTELDKDGIAIAEPAVYTAKNTQEGTITFPEVMFNEPGVYRFTVTEEKGETNTAGVIFDTSEITVSVTVTDDGSGELKVSEPTYSKEGGIAFTNNYIAKETETEIPGSKEIAGKVLGDGDFQFRLYSAKEDWTKDKLLEEKSNDASGNFTFTKQVFSAAGTYRFLVEEVNGGQTIDGVSYDSTVYRVTVTVTDNLRGNLVAETAITDGVGIPQEEVLFRNSYAVDGDDTVEIGGTKTLKGKTLQDGMFTFELYATDRSYNTQNVTPETVQNKAGKYAFSLSYTEEDLNQTFYYLIREKNGGKTVDNITYSAAEYKVAVHVADNGKGGIKTLVTVGGNETDITALNFENVYKEPTPPSPPTTPETGDAANLALWSALLAVSAVGIVILGILGRKKKEQQAQ